MELQPAIGDVRAERIAPFVMRQPFMLKRFVDIAISILGLILSLPILCLIICLIKLESPGPVFYLQRRVGLHGRLFTIYKLRSMYCGSLPGESLTTVNDPRVTRIGRFIRKTRIDEIPQFINVLKGEMSIVGPRPEQPGLTYQFSREIPDFPIRLNVKPGLTGWAQINGGYDLSVKEKLSLDLHYIRNYSIKLDLLILLRTIAVLLTGSGAR